MTGLGKVDSGTPSVSRHVVILVGLMASACALVAEARMYEWKSPASGSIQLSGTPPSWYRSPEGGPRVRVFDAGRLLDDTAIVLPSLHSAELREAAFRELKQREEMESLRKLEQAARREAARENLNERRDVGETSADEELASAQSEDATQTPPELNDETIEKLKSIIGEWDRRNSGGGSSSGEQTQ